MAGNQTTVDPDEVLASAEEVFSKVNRIYMVVCAMMILTTISIIAVVASLFINWRMAVKKARDKSALVISVREMESQKERQERKDHLREKRKMAKADRKEVKLATKKNLPVKCNHPPAIYYPSDDVFFYVEKEMELTDSGGGLGKMRSLKSTDITTESTVIETNDELRKVLKQRAEEKRKSKELVNPSKEIGSNEKMQGSGETTTESTAAPVIESKEQLEIVLTKKKAQEKGKESAELTTESTTAAHVIESKEQLEVVLKQRSEDSIKTKKSAKGFKEIGSNESLKGSKEKTDSKSCSKEK